MPSTPTEVPEAPGPINVANIADQASVSHQHGNGEFELDKNEEHLSVTKETWNGDTSGKSNDSGGCQAEISTSQLNYSSNATVTIGKTAQELTAALGPSEMLIKAPDSVLNSHQSTSDEAVIEKPGTLEPSEMLIKAPDSVLNSHQSTSDEAVIEKPGTLEPSEMLIKAPDSVLNSHQSTSDEAVIEKPDTLEPSEMLIKAPDSVLNSHQSTSDEAVIEKPGTLEPSEMLIKAPDSVLNSHQSTSDEAVIEKPPELSLNQSVEADVTKEEEQQPQVNEEEEQQQPQVKEEEVIQNEVICSEESGAAHGDVNILQTKEVSVESGKDRLSESKENAVSQDQNTDSHAQVKDRGDIEESKVGEKVNNVSETVEDFLETTDILGNGLLLKTVIKKGDGQLTRPLQGQKVTLKTEGFLPDGKVIDKNNSISFILGDGDVIAGWDIAVALLQINEIAELKCDAKYAYGSQGRYPDVRSNITIRYILELLDKEPGPNYSFISLDERLRHASVKKERGNYLFTRNDFHGAINSYVKAISIIDQEENIEMTEKTEQIRAEKIKCYNNLAAAQIKIERYTEAVKACEEVLEHDPKNVKALFRMGRAYAAQDETKEAIIQMKKALKLEPETKIIHQELSKLTKKLSKETQSERNMCKKMFRTDKPPAKPPSDYSSWKWSIIAGSLVVVLLSLGVAYFR